MKKWENYSRYLETGEWHCHTRYTDGRNTVAEMCRQASINSLELIAFTEHVTKRPSYDFARLVNDVLRARKRYPGLKILAGCEAKVLNREGELDVADDVLEKCDIVLGTFHSFPPLNEGGKSHLPSTSSRQDLESALRSMLKNPHVDVWTHPITFFQRCPLCEKDVHAIIKTCIENDVLIENNIRARYRSPRLIEVCRQMGAMTVTASDAHGTEDIRVLNPEDKGNP